MGYYGEESTRLRSAELIFQSVANQVARKAWLGRGRVPDEFRPTHSLLMTHIWLVHRRLVADEGDHKLLQEALFDRLWEDTTMRIRSMGISELMVNKSLGDVQKYSFPILVSLDQALALPSDEERNDNLGAAVWRNVWLAERRMTVEHCVEMALYLRRQDEMLGNTETAALLEGRIAWEPVPSWKGVRSVVSVQDSQAPEGEVAEEEIVAEEEEEEEEGDWRPALANTGKTYYWNIKTRETRWDKPSL